MRTQSQKDTKRRVLYYSLAAMYESDPDPSIGAVVPFYCFAESTTAVIRLLLLLLRLRLLTLFPPLYSAIV